MTDDSGMGSCKPIQGSILNLPVSTSLENDSTSKNNLEDHARIQLQQGPKATKPPQDQGTAAAGTSATPVASRLEREREKERHKRKKDRCIM